MNGFKKDGDRHRLLLAISLESPDSHRESKTEAGLEFGGKKRSGNCPNRKEATFLLNSIEPDEFEIVTSHSVLRIWISKLKRLCLHQGYILKQRRPPHKSHTIPVVD